MNTNLKPPVSKPPIFLERSGYRQRRMMDALRLLPVLGALLWLLPLFWPTEAVVSGAGGIVTMSAAMIYVFGVWGVLIVISFALRRVLRPTLEQQAAQLDDAGAGEAP